MNARNNQLLKKARETARVAGLNWGAIDQQAKQIIVYGSRATSAHKRTSDLDLLCVGHGRRFKSKKIHIIWIPETRLRSKRWLGSELATHIAAYGKWIKGDNTWAVSSRPNSYAIQLISERVLERALALREHWPFLLPVYRIKHLIRLRRDLQRYVLMHAGRPPVPAGSLDMQWRQRGPNERWISLLRKVPSLASEIWPVLSLQKISLSDAGKGKRRSSA
jgi:hypothetical protein